MAQWLVSRRDMFVGLALLLCACLLQDQTRRLSSGATAFVAPPAPFIGLSVDPRIVKRLLGVRLLAADLIWIDALYKFEVVREPEPFTPFYRAFKTIVTLDPDNLYAYYVGGLYLSVIKDDIRGASAILRAGVRHMESHEYAWKGAWQIPFALGYNLAFEEHEFEDGSRWIREAAEMPGASELVRTLAKRMGSEKGRLEVASRILLDVYRRLSRPDERSKVEKKMLEVSAQQELIELNEAFQRYLSSTGAAALPRKKQFQLFMNSVGHPRKDLRGYPLSLDPSGKIRAVAPQ